MELADGHEQSESAPALVANHNVLEWNVDLQSVMLTENAEFFETEPGTVSVLNAYLRRDGVDIPMVSIDRVSYSGIPNKDNPGRPDRYWQYRAAGAVPLPVYLANVRSRR